MAIFFCLLACLQGEPKEDKEECKKALDAFHAALHTSTEAAHVSALEVLSKHKCANAIAAIAPLLGAESEKIRIAAAKALGGMDHPKALEALTQAVPGNEGSPAVLEGLAKALQTLDWEAGAEPLQTLLQSYHEKGRIEELHVLIPVLGSLGSSNSVDPLLRLLEHAENEGKTARAGKLRSAGNPKLAALEGPIKAALQSITGGSEPNYAKWKEYWHGNRDRLMAAATVVYRCRSTGKRWEQKAGEPEACPNHDKPEKDGQVVKVKLHSRT